MDKVTVWSVLNEEGEISKHNHIENGWSEHIKPQPLQEEFTNQQGWQKFNWNRKYAYLVDGKVVYQD